MWTFVHFVEEYAKGNPQLADGLKLAEIAEIRVHIQHSLLVCSRKYIQLNNYRCTDIFRMKTVHFLRRWNNTEQRWLSLFQY
jgi:hypothetical protein